MRIRTVAIGVSTLVFAGTLGLAVAAQQKPVSSRTSLVVYKTPT